MNIETKSMGSLQRLAFNSGFSRGRRINNKGELYDHDLLLPLDPCLLDFVKLLNSKAIRRLDQKTQVFPQPDNPHVRSRLFHTLEVMAMATQISDYLGLNTQFCQALALGHDLGHVPFGHFGEKYLTARSGYAFTHGLISVIICQKIERRGAGLNLLWEILNCILHHSQKMDPLASRLPQEFFVLQEADRISFTFADWNDYKRINPQARDQDNNVLYFGEEQRERTGKCMRALFEESSAKGFVSFQESEVAHELSQLQQWLDQHVYTQISFDLEKSLLDALLAYFQQEPLFQGWDPYFLIALMTDREVREFGHLWNRINFPGADKLSHFGIVEIVQRVKNPPQDFSPDLEW